MSTPAILQKTPLNDAHRQLGARLVDFGGWEMPIQYSGIIQEHKAVRHAVGVFDISHMGQFFVTGKHAPSWLDSMLTNDVKKLQPGACHYTFLLNEQGGVIDDLILYHFQAGKYLLIVNAAKIEEDFMWLSTHLAAEVDFDNRSEAYFGLALQGPESQNLYTAFFENSCSCPARNQIAEIHWRGAPLFATRTGYTGEDGFEFFGKNAMATAFWDALLECGKSFGLEPCGLGARDTLRLEMCYPLNGADLSPTTSPLEAGLGFFVSLEKESDFMGKSALSRQKAQGLQRKLCAISMLERTPPPRAHYPVFADGEQVSELTSGCPSPSLDQGIGMAYLPINYSAPGTKVEIGFRSRRFSAIVQKKPFYKKT